MHIEIQQYDHARQQQRHFQILTTMQYLIAVGSIAGGLALLYYASSCGRQNEPTNYWLINNTTTSAILQASKSPPNPFWQTVTDRLNNNLNISALSQHKNEAYKRLASYRLSRCNIIDFSLATNNSALFNTVQSVLLSAGAQLLTQNTAALLSAIAGIALIGISCALCTQSNRNSEHANSWQRQVELYKHDLNAPLLGDCENPTIGVNGVEMKPLSPCPR